MTEVTFYAEPDEPIYCRNCSEIIELKQHPFSQEWVHVISKDEVCGDQSRGAPS